MRTGISITLTAADFQRLEAIISSGNSPQKHVWRARIILMTGQGMGTHAIMSETGKSKTTIWRWQERFAQEGIDGLLRDKTRPPGKAPISGDRVSKLIRLTLSPPPHEATHWTLRAAAKATGPGVKIWKAHGLAPHRWRQFKLFRDPAFADKL